MRTIVDHRIAFRSNSGALVAHVSIVPINQSDNSALSPLVEVDEDAAREFGETRFQLRESERYEYEVDSCNGSDLRLRSSLSTRRRSLGQGGEKPDSGLIETRSFCGTLLLELVEGHVDDVKAAVASAVIDVRSLKLNYRTEYRGMLRRISDEIAGLVVDVRSSAKIGFNSTFVGKTDAGWLQVQLELLRDSLDSSDFSSAMQRIVNFPHERLSTVRDSVASDRPIRWTHASVRQLVTANPRRKLSTLHPLFIQYGLESVAERVLLQRKERDLDTIENRFVKFALTEFLAFLTHARGIFEISVGWAASAALCRRLAAKIDDWLSRSLFRNVSEMRFAPFGSPVLQRKAGYRELLRLWLRFHAGAELSWDGGEDLFRAGQRDVASLYEYWLFFELLDWFCRKCRGGVRPRLEELVDGLETASPNLKLRKRIEIGPFVGTFVGHSRRLNARFAYNRRFEVTHDRNLSGSWTRRLHPDYTLTFWPAELSESDAERQELLVHVHFDAKYRVENIDSLFGVEAADDADDELEGNYKRQDLLKMHAYRDAIKRSQGAYVLYPGRSNAAVKLQGFHEILPGLGAFGVSPDENGMAHGMESLTQFLDEVLFHLGNRTTSQERLSFHVAESYEIKEQPVQYGSLLLPERDELYENKRALPPSEHHVVVAWYNTPQQLEWTLTKGIANVRLGDRPGAWHIPPEIASARHILLRSHRGEVADGLFRLRSPGYKVYSANDLKAKGYPGVASGEIYAVFNVEPDVAYLGRKWDEQEVTNQIKDFESRRACRQVDSLRRRSPDPRVLS